MSITKCGYNFFDKLTTQTCETQLFKNYKEACLDLSKTSEAFDSTYCSTSLIALGNAAKKCFLAGTKTKKTLNSFLICQTEKNAQESAKIQSIAAQVVNSIAAPLKQPMPAPSMPALPVPSIQPTFAPAMPRKILALPMPEGMTVEKTASFMDKAIEVLTRKEVLIGTGIALSALAIGFIAYKMLSKKVESKEEIIQEETNLEFFDAEEEAPVQKPSSLSGRVQALVFDMGSKIFSLFSRAARLFTTLFRRLPA